MKSERAMGFPYAGDGADGNSNAVVDAVGIISGTSMDAVDVARVATDGVAKIVRGPALARPYTHAERAEIRAVLGVCRPDRASEAMRRAEAAVTQAHCDALARFIDAHGTPDLVGWHGQTVAHDPQRGVTVQLGDFAAMAQRFGVPVVGDFRSADVAAGGEGAPLVPAYHRALVAAAKLPEPVLVINLGGVANVTYIDGDTLLAFDTGPASALMDDAMAEIGEPYDAGGRLAATGTPDPAALARLLEHPFFAQQPPKSLDRDAFAADAAGLAALEFPDRLATLAHFSASAIARALDHCPGPPRTVVAAGGGTHNAFLVDLIARALSRPVRLADATGFSSDFMEAEAFGYLAVRSVRGLAITFPGTTAVDEPLTGGRLFNPPATPAAPAAPTAPNRAA